MAAPYSLSGTQEVSAMMVRRTCPKCMGNRRVPNERGDAVPCIECGGKGWKPVMTGSGPSPAFGSGPEFSR